MNLTSVGHAGFVVSAPSGGHLLIDPWLFGSVFNDGWKLLVPSVLTDEQLKRVTHIWFSHEHPDHFHPPSLKFILAQVQHPPTVLFQPTRDRRVESWCGQNGFPVETLKPGVWSDLGGNGLKVVIGKSSVYDSWIAIDSGDRLLLNLNDCPVVRPDQFSVVRSFIGERAIDVLITQFSYANWLGDPEHEQYRKSEAAARLERVRTQVQALEPSAVVPAASYVKFSHAENSYLNDFAVRVERAVALIEDCNSTPVVMLPGETWIVGSEWNNAHAVSTYNMAMEEAQQDLQPPGEPVAFDELRRVAADNVARTKERNNRLLLRLAAASKRIRPVELFITDLAVGARFHPLQGLSECRGKASISLSSESLYYTLRYDWGLDTLLVNGRFRAGSTSFAPLMRAFALTTLNNSGRHLRLRDAVHRDTLRLVARRLKRALTLILRAKGPGSAGGRRRRDGYIR